VHRVCSIRLSTLMNLYIHPLKGIFHPSHHKIYSFPALIHPLYPTLYIMGPTCHSPSPLSPFLLPLPTAFSLLYLFTLSSRPLALLACSTAASRCLPAPLRGHPSAARTRAPRPPSGRRHRALPQARTRRPLKVPSLVLAN
jgi:hypothetical protein